MADADLAARLAALELRVAMLERPQREALGRVMPGANATDCACPVHWVGTCMNAFCPRKTALAG